MNKAKIMKVGTESGHWERKAWACHASSLNAIRVRVVSRANRDVGQIPWDTYVHVEATQISFGANFSAWDAPIWSFTPPASKQRNAHLVAWGRIGI